MYPVFVDTLYRLNSFSFTALWCWNFWNQLLLKQ